MVEVYLLLSVAACEYICAHTFREKFEATTRIEISMVSFRIIYEEYIIRDPSGLLNPARKYKM